MFEAFLVFLLTVLLLLLLSGFFSGSETALYSLTPFDLDQIEKRSSERLRRLLNRPKRLLITILLANLFVNVMLSSVIERKVTPHFTARELGLSLSVFLSTILVLVFGEVIPKILALRKNRLYAVYSSRIIQALQIGFKPVVEILAKIAEAATWLMGPPHLEAATEDEILTAVAKGAKEGVLDRGERDMIRSIFKLDRCPASAIMTPRHEIVALPVEASIAEILDCIRDHRFSRIPIYRGSIDNIIGVLSAKDLLRVAAKDVPFVLRRFLRPVVFVPRARRVDDLIRDLQRRRLHLAVVVDEYGATAGVATLEDALEEVVGEIHDEHDVEETP